MTRKKASSFVQKKAARISDQPGPRHHKRARTTLAHQITALLHAHTQTHGKDKDIDVAAIPGAWQREYGCKLVPSKYGYKKLGDLITALARNGAFRAYRTAGHAHMMVSVARDGAVAVAVNVHTASTEHASGGVEGDDDRDGDGESERLRATPPAAYLDYAESLVLGCT